MITIPAQLENVATRKDKTLKLIFGTNELTPEQITFLFSSANSFGYLAFKIESFKREELNVIENLKADIDDNLKTPSQRLRGVLYVLYEKDNEGFKTFTKFYEYKMEQLITFIKTKLD